MLARDGWLRAQWIMEWDVIDATGAGCGEKTAERLAQRNGDWDRTWETRAGTVDLRIPKRRKGSYFPDFLESRRMAEKALTAVIQEAYAHCISTRSVDDLAKAMRDNNPGDNSPAWLSRRQQLS